MRRLKNSTGFTLIEVIVSIAVFGIMAVSILTVLYVSMLNNIRSRSGERAASAAQAVMEYFKVQGSCGIEKLVCGRGRNNGLVLCFSLKENEIPDLSGVLSDSSRCRIGLGSEEFVQVDSLASSGCIEYDYAVKVMLDIKDDNPGHGKLAQIGVTLWNRMDKGLRKVSLLSLQGE